MFGMGFMEIMLIAIIAVIALGPEKLPTAMVDMAKMFKKIKGGIDDAKSTIDNELNITEMKSEADKLKAQLSYSTESLNAGLDNIMNDDDDTSSDEEAPKKKKKKVSFKEKEKKKSEDEDV
ncbi:MAG: Sec-independent protein translocase subunit TatB [Campylobacteraceae bacterium]|jgi:sec-independent protein translocase protein TatB|nr:Sec-independent protein translocase subunit TatB [Campylobacteraceae bacterium]MBT3882952.1 Sec-independent protein translocase subunit TatB [Campylobacteraceae bacterium]MBT4030064.1 Sec-independent protein translocase subunit TatB [Campylobacteraceae bacterium]MBT4179218.1 Sec-independent protein translocase subunit TatB [Campylobacteraceae bacterium]MBT4573140.1 Sec-independent protein translocase subunit TatB [Campylobacteraceae bacterium]